MEKVTRIGRTFVKAGHVVDYYEDDILLPDGKVAKWDFVKHKGAAAVVAVRDDGKILMVRQYRSTADRETLEIPAGARNYPEEPTIVTAARELEEETGYRSEDLTHLLRLRTAIAYTDEIIDVYLARHLVPTQRHLDPDEYLDAEAWELKDLIRLIFDRTIEDAKTIAAIMSYAAYAAAEVPEGES